MKTRTLMIFSLLAAVYSTNAFALEQTGWERPVLRAKLVIQSQQGGLPESILGAHDIELVMTQQDGSHSPTGFVLLNDGQFKQAYQVKSVSRDSCNSVRYDLVAIQDSDDYRLEAATTRVQVIDHSNRTCLDYRKFRWELDLRKVNVFHELVSQVNLGGAPESVITAQ